jgi:hypothetical protein
MKIVETSKALTQMDILFGENTVEDFSIAFGTFSAEETAKCVTDFGDIVGSVTASMVGKPMSDDEPMEMSDDDMMRRQRRGGHFISCTNVFANELCAAFVTMDDGGGRQRRKGTVNPNPHPHPHPHPHPYPNPIAAHTALAPHAALQPHAALAKYARTPPLGSPLLLPL